MNGKKAGLALVPSSFKRARPQAPSRALDWESTSSG